MQAPAQREVEPAPANRAARRSSGGSGVPWASPVWPFAILAAGATIMAWALASFTLPSGRPARAVPFLLVLAFVVAAVVREVRGRRLGLLSPLMFALLAVTIMFGVVPLFDLVYNNPYVHNDAWWGASWLALLSVLWMYVGYGVAFKLIRRPRGEWTTHWRFRTALIVSVVFMAVAVGSVLIELQHLGGLLHYVENFRHRHGLLRHPVSLLEQITLATPALLLLAGSWIRRPTWRWAVPVFLVWLPLALSVSGLLGERWRDLTLLVSILAVVHLGYRRIPRLAIAVAALVLAGAFVAVGITRNVVGTEQGVRSIAGSNFYHNYLATHELGQFRDLVVTVEGVPGTLPYQYGRTFLSLIPRAPFPTGGYLYSTTFFPEQYARGTSYPDTLPGELYMNFGAPGVVVGMILFGLGVGLIEAGYRRTHGSVTGVIAYAYSLVPMALILRGDFTSMAGFYLLTMIVLLAGAALVERPARDSPSTDAVPIHA